MSMQQSQFPAYNPLRHAKRSRCSEGPEGTAAAAAEDVSAAPGLAPLPFSFDILRRITQRGRNDPSFYWSNDMVHVMYDAFPKASVHLLVLPRDTSVDNLLALARRLDKSVRDGNTSEGEASAPRTTTAALATPEPPELRLLREMVRVGSAIVEQLSRNHDHDLGPSSQPLSYQIGFHAVPSLKHLHMHVMSQDFENGAALKHKKHYQSFATAFFVPATAVVRLFEAGVEAFSTTAPAAGAASKSTVGGLERQLAQWKPLEALLTAKEMACFWCGQSAKTMPVLLGHLRDCPRRRRR